MRRTSAEEQGIPTSVIDRFIRALDDQSVDSSHAVHSVMVVKNGAVIAERWWHPFRPGDRHMLYSLSKSFTAMAVGLAVFERRLTVNDRVIDLLPDDLPAEISSNLAAMTVRDLLTMTSGHTEDAMPPYSATETNWARGILARPIDHVPGTHFVYNSGATYLLAAILTRVTGERLLDYLTPRFLQPLGIVGATWEQYPRGIDVGGWGLAITTEDIAAFGQLLLDGGEWQGRQLVPAEWVANATALQVSNGDPSLADDGTQGYGYQFWRNRHNSYRADGAFGQQCIVIPEHGIVLAMTSGHRDAQRLRDIVWSTLLAGLESPDPSSDSIADAAMVDTLELPHPHGEPRSPSDISGEWTVDANAWGPDSVLLAVMDGGTELRMRAGGTEIAVDCGYRDWRRGSLPGGKGFGELLGRGGPIAASGAWAGDEFRAVVWLTETPYALLVTLEFDGDIVALELQPNVSFADPVEVQRMSGHR